MDRTEFKSWHFVRVLKADFNGNCEYVQYVINNPNSRQHIHARHLNLGVGEEGLLFQSLVSISNMMFIQEREKLFLLFIPGTHLFKKESQFSLEQSVLNNACVLNNGPLVFKI